MSNLDAALFAEDDRDLEQETAQRILAGEFSPVEEIDPSEVGFTVDSDRTPVDRPAPPEPTAAPTIDLGPEPAGDRTRAALRPMEQKFTAGVGAEQEAIQAQQEAGIVENFLRQAHAQELRDNLAGVEEQVLTRNDRLLAATEEERAKVQQARADYLAPENQARMNQLMGQQRQANFANAIALGLGAAAQILGRTSTNPVAAVVAQNQRMFERMFDEELRRQKKMKEDKRTALAFANTELAQAEKLFGAGEEANMVAKDLMSQRLKLDLEANLSGVKDQMSQAVAAQNIAQLDQKSAQMESDLASRRLQLENAEIDRELAARQQRIEGVKAAMVEKTDLTPGFDTRPGVKLTEKTANDFNAGVGKFSGVMQTLQNLREIRSTVTGRLKGALTGNTESLAADLWLQMKEYKNLGAAFTETESELIRQATGTDKSAFIDWVANDATVLARLERDLQEQFGKRLKVLGLSPREGIMETLGMAEEQELPNAE